MSDNLKKTITELSVKTLRKGFYIRSSEMKVFQKIKKIERNSRLSSKTYPVIHFENPQLDKCELLKVQLWSGSYVEHREQL